MAADDLVPAGEKVNIDNLYRQETYTDLGFGTIQCLTPVTADGAPDASRKPIFMGTAQIMTGHGALPVQAEINAETLRAACEAFPAALKEAVNNLVEQAKQIERERQGGIVIPRDGRLEMP